MLQRKAVFAATVIVSLGGCHSYPGLHGLQSPSENPPEGPTVAELVQHIQCEIHTAIISHPIFDLLQKQEYAAAVNMTVEVYNTEGFNPSLNFIRPFHDPMTNLTMAVSGQLNRTQHRNFNYVFPIKLGGGNSLDCPLTTGPGRLGVEVKAGDPLPDQTDIGGSMGLDAVLYTGLMALNVTAQPLKAPPAGQLSQNYTFASQVDFTVVGGIGLGPTWTLTNFKGPVAGGGGGGSGGGSGSSAGGGSGSGGAGPQGLLNYNNTTKDTLIISFAPVVPPVDTARRQKDVDAKAASVAEYQRQIADRKQAVQRQLLKVRPKISNNQKRIELDEFVSDLAKPSIQAPATANAFAQSLENFQKSNPAANVPELNESKESLGSLAKNLADAQKQLDAAKTELEHPTPSSTERESAEQTAYEAAQANNTRLILQSLLPLYGSP